MEELELTTNPISENNRFNSNRFHSENETGIFLKCRFANGFTEIFIFYILCNGSDAESLSTEKMTIHPCLVTRAWNVR